MTHTYACQLRFQPCDCEEVAVVMDLLDDPDFDVFEVLVLEAFIFESL